MHKNPEYCGICGSQRDTYTLGDREIPTDTCGECRVDNPEWIRDRHEAAYLRDTRAPWMRRESIHPELLP